MATAPPSRMDTLGKRVRWLDRYRRLLTIGMVVVLAPLLWSTLAESFGTSYSVILGTALLVGLWAILEVVFAYVTALWETEHEEITRANGLPRAVLRRPRRN
jgi:hypothetical protein